MLSGALDDVVDEAVLDAEESVFVDDVIEDVFELEVGDDTVVLELLVELETCVLDDVVEGFCVLDIVVDRDEVLVTGCTVHFANLRSQ